MDTARVAIHECSNCQRYTAVIDGWAHDFERDGFTPSTDIHRCGESDRPK